MAYDIHTIVREIIVILCIRPLKWEMEIGTKLYASYSRQA